MPEIRVDLQGALAGHYVVVDDDALTLGVLEDMQSPRIGDVLEAVASCLAGGNMPSGIDHAGLRKLRPAEFKSLADALAAAVAIPKAL